MLADGRWGLGVVKLRASPSPVGAPQLELLQNTKSVCAAASTVLSSILSHGVSGLVTHALSCGPGHVQR